MNLRRLAAVFGRSVAVALLLGAAADATVMAQVQQECTIGDLSAFDVVQYLDTHQLRADYIPAIYPFDQLTDPDQLVGVEGQYTSKAGFDDVRVPIGGGIVEVFTTRADRAARVVYLQKFSQTKFAETYVTADRVLLRLANGLGVQAQDDYRMALNSLCRPAAHVQLIPTS